MHLPKGDHFLDLCLSRYWTTSRLSQLSLLKPVAYSITFPMMFDSHGSNKRAWKLWVDKKWGSHISRLLKIKSSLLELMFADSWDLLRRLNTICATITIVISIYKSMLHWIKKIMKFNYYLLSIPNVKIMVWKVCLCPARTHDQPTASQEASRFTTQVVMSCQRPRNCARSHVIEIMKPKTVALMSWFMVLMNLFTDKFNRMF